MLADTLGFLGTVYGTEKAPGLHTHTHTVPDIAPIPIIGHSYFPLLLRFLSLHSPSSSFQLFCSVTVQPPVCPLSLKHHDVGFLRV